MGTNRRLTGLGEPQILFGLAPELVICTDLPEREQQVGIIAIAPAPAFQAIESLTKRNTAQAPVSPDQIGTVAGVEPLLDDPACIVIGTCVDQRDGGSGSHIGVGALIGSQ